jgi:hypothetical protein
MVTTLRVRATVVRFALGRLQADLSHTLKELQPRLQLTEDQYNYWSTKKQVLLVEFDYARKIDVIDVASNKITDRSDWIAEFDQISNRVFYDQLIFIPRFRSYTERS